MQALPGRGLLSAVLLLCLFTLAALSPLALAADPDLEIDEHYFTTYRRRGVDAVFMDATVTNNSEVWTSAARPWLSVSVWIIGDNLTFNLTDGGGNFSAAGVTNATVTAFQINATNETALIWPVLLIERANTSINATENSTVWQTLNFGQMVIGREVVTIAEEVLPPSILVDEANRLLWWMGVYAVGLAAVMLLMAFLLVRVFKRRRVLSD